MAFSAIVSHFMFVVYRSVCILFFLCLCVCFTLLYSPHFLNKPFTLYVFSSFHKLTSIVFTATADYYCSLSIVFTTIRDYYCSLSIVQVKQVGHKHMK